MARWPLPSIGVACLQFHDGLNQIRDFLWKLFGFHDAIPKTRISSGIAKVDGNRVELSEESIGRFETAEEYIERNGIRITTRVQDNLLEINATSGTICKYIIGINFNQSRKKNI